MARTRSPKPIADPRWVANEFWYKAPKGAPVHERVVPHGQWLRNLYRSAHNRDRVHERLYDGVDLRRGTSNAIQALSERGFSAARLNVSKSVVNTVVSRLSKNRAMPSIKVNDADWSLKRKSKRYREFILSEMVASDFDSRSREALRDGAVVGAGLTLIDDFGDGEKVICERVLREEILVDPRECLHGCPQNMIRVHRIARDHLAELYPEHAPRIFHAPGSEWRTNDELDDDTRTLSLDDYVDVYEAWHLPRCEGDGRHVLCIDGVTLVSEEWHEPRFPIGVFRYQKPTRGFWSRGLIFELKDVQYRINCIVRDMQMNLAAVGRGFFMQQKGSAVPPQLLVGAAPYVVEYAGANAPQWTAPTPINAAQLQMLQFFIQQAFEIPGVSQAGATSKSSLGAGASGVALDTQYDIESERFAMEESQYSDYRLQCAQLYIDASKRVARKRKEHGDRPKYVSGWLGRDSIEKLDHDKVALEGDQYRLAIEPVGFIPSTRAGKLSAVGQLAQAGIIPQWLVGALFDEPDLAAANRVTLGGYYNCERKLEDCADPELPQPVPAPHNELELELKMAKAYANWAESERAPSEVVERYLTYLELLTDLMAKAKPAAAPMPMDPAAPPMDPAMAGPGMVPGVGQVVPAMSGGGLPPEVMS